MPRHTFKFPGVVVDAVRRHVRVAIAAVDPERYRQESPYTVALASRLAGVAYEGAHGSVFFASTVIDDRGRASAESIYGADLAITATVSDGTRTIRKAILVQAKLGEIAHLNSADKASLLNQIRKMKKLVDAPNVMQIPQEEGHRSPQMVSGKHLLRGAQYTPMDLEDYFVARVTTTLDGCTDRSVVSQVQNSSLMRVDVTAKLARIA